MGDDISIENIRKCIQESFNFKSYPGAVYSKACFLNLFFKIVLVVKFIWKTLPLGSSYWRWAHWPIK